MSTILDTVRQAVLESDESRYSIAKGSGVSAGQLSRLIHGQRGLSVESVEKLAAYLRLQIIIRPRGGWGWRC